MIKVFIGGSRRVTRINEENQEYLDQIMGEKCSILIGDANGADKAMQRYLKNCGYSKVEVFCMDGCCRNNLGDWKIRAIRALNDKRDFAYYSTKDQQMAQEASLGFMIWDGKSFGTIANIFRFVEQGKKVDVYIMPKKTLTTLKNEEDWNSFMSICAKEVKEWFIIYQRNSKQNYDNERQMSLFEII